MDGVATPIIGRPRPLPGHATPNPAYHPHILNYEDPIIGGVVGGLIGSKIGQGIATKINNAAYSAIHGGGQPS